MPDDGALLLRSIDEDVLAAALPGLTDTEKTLPPKLFYDDEGCRLFGLITELPEYYLTRTEHSLLRRIAPGVAEACSPGTALVEYGGSDETKAAFLLDTPRAFSWYVPIDVAGPALAAAEARLALSHPGLRVLPVQADFMEPLSLPRAVEGMAVLGFFPGSTIGNLEPPEAARFLRQARHTLGDEAKMLLGVDLRKDPALLIPAYDDAAGVTAAFNRNILTRLNREAGADFDLASFAHRAVWNDDKSRIEMHLVSARPQTVRIGGERITFRRGETIHTENSYKWAIEDFSALAHRSDWTIERQWTDPAGLFSMHLLAAA